MNYLTKNGIETFKNPLRIRKDEVHDRMLSEVENFDVFLEKRRLCHTNCRNRYTHNKELGTYTFKRMKREDEDETSLSASEMKTAVSYATKSMNRKETGNLPLFLLKRDSKQFMRKRNILMMKNCWSRFKGMETKQ